MTKYRRFRRRLAAFVYWQWRKMSLLSSIVYALLIKNSDDSKKTVEDLERYLADDPGDRS